jgi:arylsulfatase A-like enzyme
MKKKNLILISLDTVRADVAYSGKFEPINNLRKDSITFLNAISSSPLTPVSHATVFTGLQPYNHGIRHLFKEKLSENAKTLTQVLHEQGYHTAGIVSCPGMNHWYDFCRGFDFYDDEIPRLPDGTDPLETVDVKLRGRAMKRGNLVYERACQWLDNNKQAPFFLFLHFFDAHWPYEAPEKFGGDNYYEEEVAFSAHYMGKFLDVLKEKGLYDDATIVVFSDHGEDLDGLYPNDKGGEKLGHPEELGHGCLLYDQTQKVALIIKDGNLNKNQNIEEQVRLADLTPTILDLMNIDAKINFDGVSLLPILKQGISLNLPAYAETFYPKEQIEASGGKYIETENKKMFRINNKYKIITHLESDVLEYYNLEKDSNELKNLFDV